MTFASSGGGIGVTIWEKLAELGGLELDAADEEPSLGPATLSEGRL